LTAARAAARPLLSAKRLRPRRGDLCASRADPGSALDIHKMADFVAGQDLSEEDRFGLERLAAALGEPIGVVKNMAFRRRPLLALTPADVAQRLQTVADTVEVTVEQARRMAVIQPSLLLDAEGQSKVLAGGIKAICYELSAPREEVVELILNNQSVLHGRQLHLSVADIAHLAIIREPKGRIGQ